MQQQNQREENYEFFSWASKTKRGKKEVFWRIVSERYHLSLSSLREIMNRSPVVLAGSLSLDEARHLLSVLSPWELCFH